MQREEKRPVLDTVKVESIDTTCEAKRAHECPLVRE